MPTLKYARCKTCGRHRDEAGPLSHTRQCGDCAGTRLLENIDGLHFKRGEPLARWRRGMIRSAGGILPDNL